MDKSALIFLYLYLISCYSLNAQAINDNIENRITLQLEKPFSSNTKGCTVQWDCVDESLTGKCIDYHNDQWFSFSSTSFSTLYINISKQSCRDMRGVQLVALKGEPCNIPTYEILTCVSLANQDDIYVELSSLEEGQEYLINIDGYLHDFCSFEIEVSQFPKGLSLDQTLNLPTQNSRENHLIHIEWVLPDSIADDVESFEILRRIHPNLKNRYLAEVPREANAYGKYKREYHFEDSIAPDLRHFYKLAARFSNGKLVPIKTFEFYHKPSTEQPKFISSVLIPLGDVKNKNSMTVIVIDPLTYKVIDHEVFTYYKKFPKYFKYRTGKALQLDVDKIEVKVINNTSKATSRHTFDLWRR